MKPCPPGTREVIFPWSEIKILNYKQTLQMLREYLEEGRKIRVIIANGGPTGVGIVINTKTASRELSRQLRLAWLATQ